MSGTVAAMIEMVRGSLSSADAHLRTPVQLSSKPAPAKENARPVTQTHTVTSTEQETRIQEGFQRGERWAFEAAARLHFESMVNYVWSLLRDRDKALELVQESFFLACRSHERYDASRPLAPWLFRIARNMAYKEHNRRKRNPVMAMDDVYPGEEATFDPPSQEDSPHDDTVNRDLMARIQKAIDSLKPAYRDVLILRMMQGMPSEQVSKSLDIPVPTVNTRLYRALEQLRRICRQQGIREEELFS